VIYSEEPLQHLSVRTEESHQNTLNYNTWSSARICTGYIPNESQTCYCCANMLLWNDAIHRDSFI